MKCVEPTDWRAKGAIYRSEKTAEGKGKGQNYLKPMKKYKEFNYYSRRKKIAGNDSR